MELWFNLGAFEVWFMGARSATLGMGEEMLNHTRISCQNSFVYW